MLITCPSCGATNRVPDPAAGKTVRCGRCKTTLTTAAAPITITDANFAEVVERSPIPVLLDLWAAWCGPCHMLAPTIDQLAREMNGRIRVGKLNIDEQPAIADRFGVRSIPTLLVFHGGREVDRLVGVQPKTEISRRIEAVIRQQEASQGGPP
jgi:thioredoxin 2